VAVIAAGEGHFLDAIPAERWHDTKFCQEAYCTGSPNVDSYVYYYGGERMWREVLRACSKRYRLPAVVPVDAEQLPSGNRGKAVAVPDKKAPEPDIRRLPEEFVSRITALTGDPLSDVYVNMDVIQGPGRRRERARATAREAATRLELVRSGQRLGMFPHDKQTYRMVMTAASMNDWALNDAAPKYRSDPAICLQAAKTFKSAIRWVNVDKLSPENYFKICMAAASNRGEGLALQYVRGDRIGPTNYLRLCLAAVEAGDPDYPLFDLLHANWEWLEVADHFELLMAAARKGWLLDQAASLLNADDYFQVCLAAADRDRSILAHVDVGKLGAERYLELCQVSLKKFSEARMYVKKDKLPPGDHSELLSDAPAKPPSA
jgi:hypothetical protein